MKRALAPLVFAWGFFVFSSVFPPAAWARLSEEEVIKDATPAIASIYAYDEKDSLLGRGTGFFVSSKGELVTNFRVLRRAHRVTVKTFSGEILTVRGMVAENQKFELIKLLVRVRGPTSWLTLADRLPEKGQQVLVVGSTREGAEGVSRGWVSGVQDVPRFGSLVQINVPGSSVQSGSPILDEEGLVVGVVSILHEAQEIHIAVPAYRLGEMEAYSYVVPLSVWSKNTPSVIGTISLSVTDIRVDQNNYYPEGSLEPHELLANGVEAYFLGRYEEAVLALRGALKHKPANPDVHYTLGMAYEALGLWEEALAAYRETVRLEPTYAMAYNSMGISYGALDRWEEALEAFQEAIRLTQTFAEAHANLGSAYRRLHRWPEAEKAYKSAVRLRPDYAEAHFYLGLVYEKLGKPGEAMYAFEEAVKFRPDYAPAHSSLGVVYIRLGRLEKGMGALKEAVRLEPTNGEALSYLGVIYGQLGHYEEEVKTLETAVRYEPFFWKAHSSLGVAYWRGGRVQEALVEFKRALRLKPDDPKAHFYLGLIYLSLGNHGGAMHEYRVLSKLDRARANKLFLLIGGRPNLPTS